MCGQEEPGGEWVSGRGGEIAIEPELTTQPNDGPSLRACLVRPSAGEDGGTDRSRASTSGVAVVSGPPTITLTKNHNNTSILTFLPPSSFISPSAAMFPSSMMSLVSLLLAPLAFASPILDPRAGAPISQQKINVTVRPDPDLATLV